MYLPRVIGLAEVWSKGQRVNASLLPTTEIAEAWKRRGPRFSSGRRSRAVRATFVPTEAHRRGSPCGSPRRHPPRHPAPPTRLSGESRKPRRPPTLRDTASTPAHGQPLRQPKRGRDVDPDFHRGDGVGPPPHPSFRPHPPSFRRTPESTRPQLPRTTRNSQKPITPTHRTSPASPGSPPRSTRSSTPVSIP